mmetsp:Transcript_55922/g.142245  ORF Transcript_55922/g.142245 Transcript_55922/m.142245 type:complete len:688 (-) Transcript_55922:1-2064(-)
MSSLTQPRRRGSATLASPDADCAVPPSPSILLPPTPTSMPTTPRSTLGSPLCTNAVRRSGVGDLAAGPRRRISMSEVELMPWLCCMAPALWHMGLMVAAVITCLFLPRAFTLMTTFVTLWASGFFMLLTAGAFLGIRKLRQGTKVDWHAKLEEMQNTDPTLIDVLHIVLLPNYLENEAMLKATLENLGRSPMARGRTRIVLAMEAREGAGGREKADRLIQQTSHLFADIFATYHPQDVPGEVAGKSSNTQWAYRHALQQYGPILLGCDPSRVFITVADADTLFHPQYLSAVSYQALTMSPHDRSWCIWQAPVLLVRNYFEVPELTKATAIGTFIFEISSMSPFFLPCLAFSSYTMSLALASHPEVDGWDTDVIAEDHHMTCKCFFAALWELFHERKNAVKSVQSGMASAAEVPAILPQLRISSVPLPLVAYLVESPDGLWASLVARFQQGRRHMQGIVEIGYILLQYSRLIQQAGIATIPPKTHYTICLLVWKLSTVHTTCNVQVVCVAIGGLTKVAPMVLSWIMQGNVLGRIPSLLQSALALWSNSDTSLRSLVTSLVSFTLSALYYSHTGYCVLRDMVEGQYYQVLGPCTHDVAPVAEGDESLPSGSSTSSPILQEDTSNARRSQCEGGVPAIVQGPLTWLEGLRLQVSIILTNFNWGVPSVIMFAAIPSIMASTSLLRRGGELA